MTSAVGSDMWGLPDSVWAALAGGVAGAGGLGGLWTYLAKKNGDDAATLRHWYTDLAARVRELETVTREQQAIITTQQATIAELLNERAQLRTERDRLAQEVHVLSVQVAHLTQSETM
jgi:hypothetical protein